MTYSALANPTSSVHCTYHVANGKEILRDIAQPNVNLCIWQRPVNAEIVHELRWLTMTNLRDRRLSTSPETFDEDVREHFLRSGLDAGAFPTLLADMRQLAALFFQAAGHRRVMFRLLTTGDDKCRRFHVDMRHLRLLCTYQGPGTEWLCDEQVNRAALGKGNPAESIIRFGEPSRFEPFWVGIMKDDKYPGSEGRGLVHRSPPMSDSPEPRVIFCMDAQP